MSDREKFIDKIAGGHLGDAESLRARFAMVANLLYDNAVSTETPVDGVKASKTIDMTSANADLTYTAKDFGAGGNNISVTHIKPTADTDDIVIEVVKEGDKTEIKVNLKLESGSIVSTAAQVKTAIDADEEASALVAVAAEGTGAGTTNAIAKTALEGGVTVTPGEVGALRFDTSKLYVKTSEQVWKETALS